MKGHQFLETGFVIAMNDSENVDEYDYPEEVKFVIRQEQHKDYAAAADFINESDAGACVIEHEFGIYGGESGIYLLSLMQRLKKPVIVVLHTILKEPNYTQKLITREMAKYASSLVVMSKRAVRFLKTIYHIPEEKIALIEHGVPDLEAPEVNPVKQTPLFKDHKVLFTFGLISRNKGLETVVQALPKIVERHPDVMYVVLGNTHPGVLKNSGEEYRDSLKEMARDLNVEKHLTFVGKFVNEEELMHYLDACDIYVTPYLNAAQITSGTLSYAVGAGTAVVSTPYWHAEELLDNNRGCLFDFKDSDKLAEIVIDLLDNEAKANSLRQNAYMYGLHLRWPSIGRKYIAVLEDSIHKLNKKHEDDFDINSVELPPFNLSHIKRLTDSTGLIQHAKYGIPNFHEGYCLDDNSRALILMLMSYQEFRNEEALDLFPVYLSYIHYMQREDGDFRNFLSYSRNFLDERGSEDSFGRTIWAIGLLINSSPNNSYREFGEDIFRTSIPHFKSLRYIRGVANTVIGLSYYLKVHPSNLTVMDELKRLTAFVTDAYLKNRRDDWHWFEGHMTYDNAILPLCLFHSCEITGNEEVKRIAIESSSFLEMLTLKEYFSPVGNAGWHQKGGNVPIFDQQAIETMAMVLMYSQAYKITKDNSLLQKMHLCYMWFLGENELKIPLYDNETHGCCDGLETGKLNRNQGAESTLAYLISYLCVANAICTNGSKQSATKKNVQKLNCV